MALRNEISQGITQTTPKRQYIANRDVLRKKNCWLKWDLVRLFGDSYWMNFHAGQVKQLLLSESSEEVHFSTEDRSLFAERVNGHVEHMIIFDTTFRLVQVVFTQAWILWTLSSRNSPKRSLKEQSHFYFASFYLTRDICAMWRRWRLSRMGRTSIQRFGSTPPGTGVKAQRTQRRLYRFGRNEAVLVYVLDLADFSNTALARRGCIPRHLPFTSHLVVNDRHPSQGLDLLHRMRGGPVLGQMLLPQTRYFLSEEHAEFVRGGFEEGSQAFDPTPVRTVAHRMVAMLARAAGGMGKLRALVRSQDTCIKFCHHHLCS